MMKARTVLTAALGLAILALPAAVPASQPASVSVLDLTPGATVAVPPRHLAMLFTDPHQPVELSISLPADYTELGWINDDPFAR